jgi:hypothetical protein
MTYRDLEFVRVPTVLRGPVASSLVGVLMLGFDLAAQALSHAFRAPLDREEGGPAYDALKLLGRDTALPRYPIEGWNQHRARINRAWDDWPLAAGVPALIGQLAAAGFPNAELRYYLGEPGPHGEPAPYYSQFWVYLPKGSHPVTGPGAGWGSFNWGDGTLWGPAGITFAQIFTLRSIIAKWKPGQWVCRGVLFDVGGPRWGQFAWGDGSVWGGLVELGV